MVPLFSLPTEDILDEFLKTLQIPNIQGVFKIKLIAKSGDTREIEALAYQRLMEGGIQNNRLFVFNFPPTVRGTSLLLHAFHDERDDNMWIYLPAIDRVKRIALESSGGGNFMGSDFTYQDLINNNYADLFMEQLEETTIDGVEYYVIKAWGRTEELKKSYGYSAWVSYHRKDNFMLQRRDYYDFNDELLKIYFVESYLEFLPYIYPNKMSMANVQSGHTSILEVNDVTIDEIPENYFTTRFMQSNR